MIATQMMQATADRIKALRAARALTQEDLAALAGRSVASIYRIERGEKVGADTLASIAAAFDTTVATLTAAPGDDQPSLPLGAIEGGRALVNLLAGCSRIDFGFDELDTLDQAEALEDFSDFCTSLVGDGAPTSPLAITRSELEARAKLAQLADLGFVLSGAPLPITAHEVDDEGGTSIAILFAQWDETIAVLRIGVGRLINRAYVFDSLGQWETPKDGAILYPPGTRGEDYLAAVLPAEEVESDPPSRRKGLGSDV